MCAKVDLEDKFIDCGEWCDVFVRKGLRAAFVAVKRVKAGVDGADLQLDREARILSSITDIVESSLFLRTHLALFVDYSGGELVMEYVDGQRFDDYLAQAQPTLQQVYELLEQCFEILLALQRCMPGFCHCDLNLGNILVAANPPHVSFIDFAQAGQYSGSSVSLPPVSPKYASPVYDALYMCERILVCSRNDGVKQWISTLCASIGTRTASECMTMIDLSKCSSRCRGGIDMVDVLTVHRELKPRSAPGGTIWGSLLALFS
jgi:serine/threonine protein kinase